MIKALSVATAFDLRPFLTYLTQHGVSVKVSEESGTLAVWARNETDAQRVRDLLAQWQQRVDTGSQNTESDGNLQRTTLFPIRDISRNLLRSFLLAPVTVILIVVCALIALLSNLGNDLQAVSYLFYPLLDFSAGDGIFATVTQINSLTVFLQSLTPMFLHFGIIHLVFNMLWLWYFGSLIEALQSSRRFLLLVIFLSFAANTAQYIYSASNNFGGMSGVVYGLLGYIWVWQMLFPRSRLRLSGAMIGFFLVALVVMELVASSWIASAAHAGGLLAGMLAAVVAGAYQRMTGFPVR